MRNYTTQMDAARKNIITPEMEKVAAKERMTPEEIRALVAEGKVAICANKNHKCLDPQGVGSMLKTKINHKNKCRYLLFHNDSLTLFLQYTVHQFVLPKVLLKQ